jgi:opacity protein-like surface antigen
MTLRRFSAVSLLLLSTLVLLGGPVPVAAQAVPAATKALDISVYGGYLNTNSDYGPYRNTGEALGVDFTHPYHFPIVPSLEFRVNLTNGPAVAERTYLPGLRGAYNFHALHPYGTFLIGPGTIHFNFPNNGYQSDNSTVYALGGGLNLDVYPNFQVMADFQYQHWNLGGSDTLTPTLFLFGVTYHIPFHPFNKMSGR